MLVVISPSLSIASKDSLDKAGGDFFVLASKTFHAERLGYKNGKKAPEGENYYYVSKPNELIINWVDSNKKEFFHPITFQYAVDCAVARIKNGKRVVVSCDQGKSRSTGLAIAVLIQLGELPRDLKEATRLFKEKHPSAEMGEGIKGRLEEWIGG